MIKALRIILTLLIITTAQQAAANSWYKIEVLIFANQDSSALSEELWPRIDKIPFDERAVSLTSSDDEGGYKRLAGSSLQLHSERSRLERSGQHRVLLHTGWMQPVAETRHPRPVRIRAGDILDNGMYELDGYIAVGRGRYLHFRPDLYFSRRLSPAEAAKLPTQHPTVAQTNATEPQQPGLPVNMATPENTATNISSQFPAIPDILTVNQSQARRMRSGELHFIDHPLMGILVKISPLN